jgi:hypothetical protein
VGSIVAEPLPFVALTAAERSQCMVAAGLQSMAGAERSFEAHMAAGPLQCAARMAGGRSSRAVLIASVRTTAAASGTERGGAIGADGGTPMA